MRMANIVQNREKCCECSSRSEHFFCNLPEEASEAFRAVSITHLYSRGTMLFVEGQPANGVYVLCSGRVKLSTYSEDGKALILRIGEAGEVLGLSAAICEEAYEATAEVLEACQAHFLRRKDFLELVQNHGTAALNAIRELSRNYHQAHTQLCSIGLSASVGDKLAKLFLEWCDRYGENKSSVHIPMSYTHEELAEMIGTSRETVTRLLKDFKIRKLIDIQRSDLYIPDRKKLESAIGTNHRVSANVM